MSKNSLLYILGLLVLIVGFYACERDDSEPSLEMRQFTRLYVSFEEYGTSNNRADTNIRIIYPADSSVFGFNGRHVAPIRGGGPISYERDLNAMFHASINPPGSNDTAISVLSLGSSGSLTNAGVMKSRFYSNVKGMAYHRALNVLYVVNGTGPDAGVYVVETPRYGNNEKQPAKKLRNSGLNMWGAAYQNDKLFASKTSAPAGIYVFDKISSKEVNELDSIGSLSPERILEIDGAANLRGLFYDTVKNVLAVTDYSTATPSVGRILIFEDFSSMLEQEKITPTRIITGANTGLVRPVDVVIDTREAGVYLYVADREARKVSRFLYTDNGDVEPNKVLETGSLQYGRTPVSLTLDTRE